MNRKKVINLHLISDSTGETLSSVARAVMSQFEGVDSNDFIWPLVRTKSQIQRINESISQNPGIVMYTVLQEDIMGPLIAHCQKIQVPHISVLSDIVQKFSSYLNVDTTKVIGRQHLLDDEYFSRVEAINYTMSHDDGQSDWDLDKADIIIVGVSRTSKTPTSIYLSCRGYKTANIPFVSIDTIPKTLEKATNSLIVGLVINPEKLINIRSTRMSSLGSDEKTDYINIESVKKEISESRKLFAKLNCPVIDVTSRSVEETSAKIIQFYQSKNIN